MATQDRRSGAPAGVVRSRLVQLGDVVAMVVVCLFLGGVCLLAPAVIGLTSGHLLFGENGWGLAVAMIVGGAVALWCLRLSITLLWWVRSGVWDWRRTALRRSVRAGWPR